MITDTTETAIHPMLATIEQLIPDTLDLERHADALAATAVFVRRYVEDAPAGTFIPGVMLDVATDVMGYGHHITAYLQDRLVARFEADDILAVERYGDTAPRPARFAAFVQAVIDAALAAR